MVSGYQIVNNLENPLLMAGGGSWLTVSTACAVMSGLEATRFSRVAATLEGTLLAHDLAVATSTEIPQRK